MDGIPFEEQQQDPSFNIICLMFQRPYGLNVVATELCPTGKMSIALPVCSLVLKL